MLQFSVASHEKHDHCARMYSEALLAREKELLTLPLPLVRCFNPCALALRLFNLLNLLNLPRPPRIAHSTPLPFSQGRIPNGLASLGKALRRVVTLVIWLNSLINSGCLWGTELDRQSLHKKEVFNDFFFAGGCLGMFRAERPSVS